MKKVEQVEGLNLGGDFVQELTSWGYQLNVYQDVKGDFIRLEKDHNFYKLYLSPENGDISEIIWICNIDDINSIEDAVKESFSNCADKNPLVNIIQKNDNKIKVEVHYWYIDYNYETDNDVEKFDILEKEFENRRQLCRWVLGTTRPWRNYPWADNLKEVER